ncbi:MAG: hypothetical protein ACJ739_00920 [Acidimicrobiales bacterium]
MDVTTAIEQVEADVRSAFSEQLPEGEGFALDDDFAAWRESPFANPEQTAMAVPWTWSGRNAGLLGLDATNAEVVVRGMTVIEEDGGGSLQCRRYVDWLPALEQAGIVIFTRPIRSIDERYGTGELSGIPEYEEAMEEISRVRKDLDLG